MITFNRILEILGIKKFNNKTFITHEKKAEVEHQGESVIEKNSIPNDVNEVTTLVERDKYEEKQESTVEFENNNVFISHSSKDKAFVRSLAKDLENIGIKTWVDEAKLTPGDSLIGKIEEGLNNCSHVILILSKNSIISDWVREESHAAQLMVFSGKTKLIPLLFGEFESKDIPLFLKNRLYVDFRNPTEYLSEFEKLISAFNKKSSVTELKIAKLYSPQVDSFDIIRNGGSIAFQLFIINPSPNKIWFKRIYIGSQRPPYISHLTGPSKSYTYNLECNLYTDSDNKSINIRGDASERLDDWKQSFYGEFNYSKDGDGTLEVESPFFMSVDPQEKGLIRIIPTFKRMLSSERDGRNNFENYRSNDNDWKYTMLNSKDIPIFGSRHGKQGMTYIIFEYDRNNRIAALIYGSELIDSILDSLRI